MPELDGASILSLVAFAALFLGWMFAPGDSQTVVHVSGKMSTDPAAA